MLFGKSRMGAKVKTCAKTRTKKGSIFKNRFFIGKNTALLLMILQKTSRSNKE